MSDKTKTIRLYKYLKLQYAHALLDTQRIKVSRISELNDPFEFLPAKKTEHFDLDRLTSFKEGMGAEYGIVCFSKNFHNPVIWAHYADSHRGVALMFEVSDYYGVEVAYTQNRFELGFCEKTNSIVNIEEAAEKLISTKYIDWEYEGEYRKFIKLADCQSDAEQRLFRDLGNDFILRQVIFGCNSSGEEKQRLVDTLVAKFPNIEIKHAKMSETDYLIEI